MSPGLTGLDEDGVHGSSMPHKLLEGTALKGSANLARKDSCKLRQRCPGSGGIDNTRAVLPERCGKPPAQVLLPTSAKEGAALSSPSSSRSYSGAGRGEGAPSRSFPIPSYPSMPLL